MLADLEPVPEMPAEPQPAEAFILADTPKGQLQGCVRQASPNPTPSPKGVFQVVGKRQFLAGVCQGRYSLAMIWSVLSRLGDLVDPSFPRRCSGLGPARLTQTD
jgi:hypothetical protein